MKKFIARFSNSFFLANELYPVGYDNTIWGVLEDLPDFVCLKMN